MGIGSNHVEYEALGQDFHARGARQEEQRELLRRPFTEPVVDFSGRFDRIDRASLIPKPTSLSRSGLVDPVRKTSTGLPDSPTASSFSVVGSITPSIL